MSTAIQSQYVARQGAGYRALGLALLLAAALPLLAPTRPAISANDAFSFLDTGEIETVSFLEDNANTASPQPAPPTKAEETRRNEQAPLFGMETEPLFGGNVLEKWSRAKDQIAEDLDTVARCRTEGACPTPARKLIDLSRQGTGRSGRAKVGLINRAVDLAIGPVSDEMQWGVPDHWSAPFETIRSGRGDCEDYAIVKYAVLVEAGISKDDLKIVILKNRFPDENHAVVAVRVDGQWLILDNRTLTLVRDRDLTRATPQLVLDQGGVSRFVSKGDGHRTAG